MITREDVVLWLKQNPAEAGDILYQFALGVAAGMLKQMGRSDDYIRDSLERALSETSAQLEKRRIGSA